MKAAELNLAAEKATAEDEKASLLEKKLQQKQKLKQQQKQKQLIKLNKQVNNKKSLLLEIQLLQQKFKQYQLLLRHLVRLNHLQVVLPAESTSYTPAPVKQRPTYSTNASSYPVGQCTWGVKTLAPWAGDYWGNGGQWAASAAAAGFRTGSTPQVGAIACWDDGGYGHVAVVTAVESSTRIQVSECNYDGSGTQPIGNYRGWFNPTASRGTVRYIYPN